MRSAVDAYRAAPDHRGLVVLFLALLAFFVLAPAVPAHSQTAPPEDTRVFVSRFVVTGVTVFGEASLHAELAAGEGRELTLAQIEGFAARITALYRERGYILARAFVPAQEMREGVVEIAVLEGRVAQVDVAGLRHYRADSLRRYVEPRSPGRVFEANDFERGLLLLNDLPGLSVKSTLRPGAETGTTDLVLDVDKDRLITGALDANNYGSPQTGYERIQTTAGSVTAASGSGGVFVNETDGASFTATAGGAGVVNLVTGGALTVAGPITSGSGAIDVMGSSIVQSASVSTGGTGTVTATATAGGITMADGTVTTAAGTGAVSYQAPGTVTLGLLSAPGGAVTVNSTGGSILDGNTAALNILAGAAGATLNAGGVIGTLAAPIDVNVGGLVNVNAAGSIFNPPGPAIGTSINMAGVDADNTLHFLPTVPGQIFWNGVLLSPLAPPVPGGGAATAAAARAALQDGTPACRYPLAASELPVDPGNALCHPVPASQDE